MHLNKKLQWSHDMLRTVTEMLYISSEDLRSRCICSLSLKRSSFFCKCHQYPPVPVPFQCVAGNIYWTWLRFSAPNSGISNVLLSIGRRTCWKTFQGSNVVDCDWRNVWDSCTSDSTPLVRSPLAAILTVLAIAYTDWGLIIYGLWGQISAMWKLHLLFPGNDPPSKNAFSQLEL